MLKVKEKKERALQTNLRLKGIRSNSPKAALIRNPFPPGMHGKKKKSKAVSEFGRQLKEKQILKLVYRINERTLRRIFNEARKSKESTVNKLIEILESRLDRTLFNAGFALSVGMAKNMIRDGHVLVNNKKNKSRSYEVKVGDIISLDEKIKKTPLFNFVLENLKTYNPPAWLEVDKEKLTIKLIKKPEIDIASLQFDPEPIIDLFSR
ncbi:MAG: 30S ribosomal protein S4 [Candidatus Parcubacteria bacterium]|nr:MAG: 30S ribosomal protein S4 [Candidatus Parcubacteria bacterium]